MTDIPNNETLRRRFYRLASQGVLDSTWAN
jgi:hypothetical protein